MPSLYKILILLTLSFLISYASLAYGQELAFDSTKDYLIVADFESLPNNLGGGIFVWADLEPDWKNLGNIYSWIYEPSTPGFDYENVHSGIRALRLVNGLGKYHDIGWGMACVTVGSITDLKSNTKFVSSQDVSKYRYLILWAKPVQGEEELRIFLRDGHSDDYKGKPVYTTQNLKKEEWQRMAIDLENIKNEVDLTNLVTINISFGSQEKNPKGAIIYLDDIMFTNSI